MAARVRGQRTVWGKLHSSERRSSTCRRIELRCDSADMRGAAATTPYRGYWDEHEEDTLRYAVQKHGIGAWERMRHDPDFRILRCAALTSTTAHVNPAESVQKR